MFWLVTITKNSWATNPPEFWLPIGILFPKNIMNILRLLHISCLFFVFFSHFNSVQDRCECGRELEYNLQRERERERENRFYPLTVTRVSLVENIMSTSTYNTYSKHTINKMYTHTFLKVYDVCTKEFLLGFRMHLIWM